MYKQTCLLLAVASAAHKSDDKTNAKAAGSTFKMEGATHASFQVIWAGLGGTLDGELVIEVSNVQTPSSDSDWVEKSAGTVTLSTTSGSEMLSLNGIVTEEHYRVRYIPNNVTSGTVTVYARAKG
jgi:hypothetical protein